MNENGKCCRIGVDEWLRVPSVEDVFALGDCAGFVEGVGRPELPALAQVRFSIASSSLASLPDDLRCLSFDLSKLTIYRPEAKKNLQSC